MRIVLILLLLALAGCANLNVSWQFTASYNTLVQSQSVIQHVPEEMRPEPSTKQGKSL